MNEIYQPHPPMNDDTQVHVPSDVILIAIRLVRDHPSVFHPPAEVQEAHRGSYPRGRHTASTDRPREPPSCYRRETKAVGGPRVPRIRRQMGRCRRTFSFRYSCLIFKLLVRPPPPSPPPHDGDLPSFNPLILISPLPTAPSLLLINLSIFYF